MFLTFDLLLPARSCTLLDAIDFNLLPVFLLVRGPPQSWWLRNAVIGRFPCRRRRFRNVVLNEARRFEAKAYGATCLDAD